MVLTEGREGASTHHHYMFVYRMINISQRVYVSIVVELIQALQYTRIFFSLLWHNERRMNNLSKLWHKKCKSLECVRAFFEQSFGVRLHSLSMWVYFMIRCVTTTTTSIFVISLWVRRDFILSTYKCAYGCVYVVCVCTTIYVAPWFTAKTWFIDS